MGLAMIVHGGAGSIPPTRYAAAAEGCRAAALAGWRVLQGGGSALDAVQAAIVVLEDDPGFNAGTGSVLTADGRAQLDAGIMDGAELQAGAVAGVERIKNPIVVARRILESPHVLLMGAGAEQFAVESGLALINPAELVTPAQHARWQHGYLLGDDVDIAPEPVTVAAESNGRDPSASRTLPRSTDPRTHATPIHSDGHKHGTVGAVAVDARGAIAAGASTGGIGAKHPGRIGDTPLVGCGYYAENGLGGVSSTGHGEDFVRLVLARRAVELLARGHSAQSAASSAIRLLAERTGGYGGLILLDAQGRVGYARNTPSMAHAFILEGMDAPFGGA
jgi:beta-aspartyl-peptidase (threonine type)